MYLIIFLIENLAITIIYSTFANVNKKQITI